MKFKKKLAPLCIVIAVALLSSCSNNSSQGKPFTKTDSVEVGKTILDAYKWHYDTLYVLDFFPIEVTNNIIIGIHGSTFERNMEALKNYNFFADTFLINYERLVDKINVYCKEDTAKHIIEDVQPWEDFDIFCNCQESSDKPLADMYFEKLAGANDTAFVKWNWKAPYALKGGYYIRLKKEKNKWKITNMQGFDDLYKRLPDYKN